MQPIWSLVLVAVAFLVIMHLRNRRRPRRPPAEAYVRRIVGAQIVAYVHPRMGKACLFDHGMQYGKGFRRKEGPALPHEEGCRCRSVPFSFTSSEVFNGALRREMTIESTIPDFSSDQARRLVERLRATSGDPLPETAEAYVAAVDLSHFEEAHRTAVESFLRERYAYLRQAPEALPAAEETPGDEGEAPARPAGTS